tara:strand:- start:798 stop:1004 length:207 start_codon:yes stop_codon:yes gene_type:complete
MDRKEEIELLESDVFNRIEKETQRYCHGTTVPNYGDNRQEKKDKLKKLFEIMAELKGYEREYDKLDSL